MVNTLNQIFLRNITLKSLRNGYPVLYPPPLIWSDVSWNRVKKTWVDVAYNLNCDSKINKICLYVHIPYCQSRCFYCNCTSSSLTCLKELERYLKILKKEIRIFGGLLGNTKFSSLYIGGGTPSLLDEYQIEDLVLSLRRNFHFEESFLFAMDAHPNSLNFNKLNQLKMLGLKRLTIGVESLDTGVLRKVGRKQTKESVYRAVNYARRVGIPYVNIDLMAGLPGQTIQSFVKSLLATIRLNPDIIHVNPFIPDEHTLFAKAGLNLTKQNLKKRNSMMQIKKEIMHRFSQYKSIGRAKSTQSKEAINPQIDLFESPELKTSILGLGYGAISYAFGNLCYRFSGGLKEYLKSLGSYEGHKMNIKEEIRYYIIKFLRQGIDKNKFFKLFGIKFDSFFKKETEYLKKNLECKDDSLSFRRIFENKKQYFMFSKVFYSKNVINIFRRKFYDIDRVNKDGENLDVYVEED